MGRVPGHLDEDVQAVVSDLRVDRFLTLGQLGRRYGVTLRRLREMQRLGAVELRSMELRPTYWSKPSWFTVASLPGTPPGPGKWVEHVLGLAEVRWVMRDRLDGWRPLESLGGERPDRWRWFDVFAYDREAGGKPAVVEYDTGIYRPREILDKTGRATRICQKVIWATASYRKAEVIAELVPDADIWVIRWHDGEHYRF